MPVDVFNDLERGHEARYKLDQEQRFKAQCRSAKLFGRWAADRLGLPATEREAYAKAMIALALGRDGHAAVNARIVADLDRAGVTIGSAEVDRAAGQCYADALTSLANEYPMPLGPDHIRVGD